MLLENKVYVPTLALRSGEYRALKETFPKVKEQLIPCFLLAPWRNSWGLSKTIEKIQDAFAEEPFFLDLDRDYVAKDPKRPVVQEFDSLFDPSRNYENWLNFVCAIPEVIPCIQLSKVSIADIKAQIDRLRSFDRSFCLRLERHHFEGPYEAIFNLFSDGIADFTVILEGGWVEKTDELEKWFRFHLSETLPMIHADVPVVISYTTLPKGYSHIDGIAEVDFDNREMFSRLRDNRSRLVYGDWAATRPREYMPYARAPRDRIDFPTKDKWLFARSQRKEWDFRVAARELTATEDFMASAPPCWGTDLIIRTAAGVTQGINSSMKNAAARVNIHLHNQAFFEDLPKPSGFFDEPYIE